MMLDLDLSPYEAIRIEFDYVARSFENGEDFFLELSTNGGTTYTVLENWIEGGNPDIIEGSVQSISINYDGPLTSNTRIRFRCDASGNADDVYVDNVRIYGCTEATGLIAKTKQSFKVDSRKESEIQSPKSNENAIISNVIVAPNPVEKGQWVTINFNMTQQLAAKIQVMNYAGQTVLEQQYQGELGYNEMDLKVDGLSNGVYLIRISKGKESYVKRVIIK